MHWAAVKALLLLRRGADLLLQWLEAHAASSDSWSWQAVAGQAFSWELGQSWGKTVQAAKELTCSR